MMTLCTSWTAGAVLLALAVPAHGVDGVVLIDQNRALAGNVTPGDAAGFPVSLNVPGSYRLSGNLTAPAGIDGIEVGSDDVTLDLNGFRVAGSGSATAIRDTGTHRRIAIANGSLSGFNSGINMLTSAQATVRDVRSTNLSGFSIVVGANALIQRNVVQGLIQANCPSVITENITDGYITVVLSGIDPPHCVRWNNRSLTFTGQVTQ